MARVIPGDFNPVNLKRRGIISSRFGDTHYYYRRKATKDNKIKTRYITEFTPSYEKLAKCNDFWARLPPCKKEALAYQINPKLGIGPYDVFIAMCRNTSATSLEEFLTSINEIWRCWCIHPRDQVCNPYHTSSCLHLRINFLPGIKQPHSSYITQKDYIYNKCKSHVNYSESPDGWASHWGGVRLHPEYHADPSYDVSKGMVPHYWLNEFHLKTDLGIGLYKPSNVNFSIAFDGYPEYICNWIPIEFKRRTYPYDHYPPWDRDHILYYGCGMAGPNPDKYNCVGARFTPPEHKVSLCKSNSIDVQVSYKPGHVMWRAQGGTKEPYFDIILFGQSVAVLGAGGGKVSTAAGEIRNPSESRSVPISKETLGHGPGLTNWIHYYSDIQKGHLEKKKIIYYGDPKEGWIGEIQYTFKFDRPILFKANGKYPFIRIDATTPTEYKYENPGAWQEGYYPAKCSFYPGWDPYWWYWGRDPYGPQLEKGVTSYCFPYEGYWDGYRDWILIRYSASATPIFEFPFKGGGVQNVYILSIRANESEDPFDKKFYDELLKKGIKPPLL